MKSSSQVNFLAYYGSINQSTFTKFWNLKMVSTFDTLRYVTLEVENWLYIVPCRPTFFAPPLIRRPACRLVVLQILGSHSFEDQAFPCVHKSLLKCLYHWRIKISGKLECLINTQILLKLFYPAPGETSCNAIKMIKKGCFIDREKGQRTLPIQLHTYHTKIDWNEGWHDFLYNTTCQ